MAYEIVAQFHTVIKFPELKLGDLMAILEDIKKTDGDLSKIILLAATDVTAKFLTFELNKQGISTSPVLASRKERKNRRAAEGYNDGRFDVLIVSRLKMSVETSEVAHFINYDIVLPGNRSLFRRMKFRSRHHG